MTPHERTRIQESVRALFADYPDRHEFLALGWINGVLKTRASATDQIEELRLLMECYEDIRKAKGQS